MIKYICINYTHTYINAHYMIGRTNRLILQIHWKYYLFLSSLQYIFIFYLYNCHIYTSSHIIIIYECCNSITPREHINYISSCYSYLARSPHFIHLHSAGSRILISIVSSSVSINLIPSAS